MPTLTWNEIRNRATAFAGHWAGEASERAEAQTFWNDFFHVFGVDRRRARIRFEAAARRFGKKGQGRIDVFWPGLLLAEHKSAGEDLDAAYVQATDYFDGLKDHELPRYVVVSDFARIRLYVLATGKHHDIPLAKLPQHIARFGFIAGYEEAKVREEDEVNQRAVVQLGELHDALKKDGYGGRPLEVFLVRLLFCLFADDTGIFVKDSFLDVIEATREDGSDCGPQLAKLFQVLNTDHPARQKSLDEALAAFPYVNGKLFEERLDIPEFTAAMRTQLIACCHIQWASISPAIFGAMFQKIIELDAKDRRRQLGAHYTSEANILKVIGPLFLDDLRKEFERSKANQNALFAFHKKLATLNFLDPACGCGNFLVVTYRELRRVERDVLAVAARFGAATGSVFKALTVNVDQFHGIELEEFPAQIAQVAMWLADHQMNLEAGRDFGEYFSRIPLTKSANIRCGNALKLDWEAFVPPTRLSYILGNPPFIGKSMQSDAQKQDLEAISHGIKGAGVLDYVCGWHLKAAHYLSGVPIGALGKDKKQFVDAAFSSQSGGTPKEDRHSRESGNPGALQRHTAAQKRQLDSRLRGNDVAGGIEDLFVTADKADEVARQNIRCAFVSTNSICQGEQVGVLWSELLRLGMKIQFAHRTFKWSNEAPGKAAVHCIIVGFGHGDAPALSRHSREGGNPVSAAERITSPLDSRLRGNDPPLRLFDYLTVDGPPHEVAAHNINPYLVDAPDVVLPSRSDPVCDVPPMLYGSKPADGGYLLMDDDEKAGLLHAEPEAAKWVKPFISAHEFLNGETRWCLWLVDIGPAQLAKLPEVRKRVEAVRAFRAASKKAQTVELAKTPTLFAEIRQPKASYLLVPAHSSENRAFIPFGYMPPDAINGNSNLAVIDAPIWSFGVMTSTMHMAWVRYVCGRLESRYRYSAQIVYNNFPWPQGMTDAQREAIEEKAQAVLDARAEHVGATLAQLYDPLTMPPNLLKAHQALDRAVDSAYVPDGGAKSYSSDAERVAFLFRRYAALTSLV